VSLFFEVAERKVGGEAVATVNARALHEYLQVGRDFSTWIKDRIEQYGFVENVDFVCSPIPGSGRGGANKKDYHLTIGMGKELAMVERTDRGREVRQYFIACEKIARGHGTAPDRKRLRHEAAVTCKAMNEMLVMRRQQDGKGCAAHHFMNEARLINHVLIGKFQGVDRDSLTVEQLDLLAKLEMQNLLFIASGLSYAERKEKLATTAQGLLPGAPEAADEEGAQA
jgi:phage anti-repressor protein